jgi:hypothetical protein
MQAYRKLTDGFVESQAYLVAKIGDAGRSEVYPCGDSSPGAKYDPETSNGIDVWKQIHQSE